MLLYVVLILATAAAVQGLCPNSCAGPVTHYEELGCEPVFAKAEDCCPTHYNCAKIEGRSDDKCFIQGKVYNDGDNIESSVTNPHCLAGCSCRKDREQGILCAHIDCPEFLGARPLGPGCFYEYDFDHCCAKKAVCPPFDKLVKCNYGGKTYHGGQKWYAEDDRVECICKAGFKGELTAPFCKEVTCGLELLRPKAIKNKCAPVYYGSKGLCPIQWECSNGSETIIPNKGGTSEQKCSYGEKNLNIGDKFNVDSNIDCECKIPPLVTCIHKPHNV